MGHDIQVKKHKIQKEINNNYSPKWRWLVLDIYRGREANSEIIEHKMMIFNSFTVANDFDFLATNKTFEGVCLALAGKFLQKEL